MPSISWQIAYDQQEPRSCVEDDKELALYIREILDIDEEIYLTLEELKEKYDNADLRDYEG